MINRRYLLQIGAAAGAATVLVPGRSLANITREEVLFDKDAPVLGNPKGDVTIVEYFDYQCPYCKKNHPDLMKLVKSDGKIRLVLKDWPIFGDASVFASQAVLGLAKVGKYETAMEALMKLPGRISEAQIADAFAKAGIQMEDVSAAVNKYSKQINALLDRNYGQAVGLNFVGTPSFVIGRIIYPGVLDAKGMKDAVARARKENG